MLLTPPVGICCAEESCAVKDYAIGSPEEIRLAAIDIERLKAIDMPRGI